MAISDLADAALLPVFTGSEKRKVAGSWNFFRMNSAPFMVHHRL
jgi:hypothetical protein